MRVLLPILLLAICGSAEAQPVRFGASVAPNLSYLVESSISRAFALATLPLTGINVVAPTHISERTAGEGFRGEVWGMTQSGRIAFRVGLAYERRTAQAVWTVGFGEYVIRDGSEVIATYPPFSISESLDLEHESIQIPTFLVLTAAPASSRPWKVGVGPYLGYRRNSSVRSTLSSTSDLFGFPSNGSNESELSASWFAGVGAIASVRLTQVGAAHIELIAGGTLDLHDDEQDGSSLIGSMRFVTASAGLGVAF